MVVEVNSKKVKYVAVVTVEAAGSHGTTVYVVSNAGRDRTRRVAARGQGAWLVALALPFVPPQV